MSKAAVNGIKQVIANPDLCTDASVSALQDLLGQHVFVHEHRNKVAPGGRPNKVGRDYENQKRAKKTKVEATLSEQQQHALATQVANAILKHLAQTQPAAHRPNSLSERSPKKQSLPRDQTDKSRSQSTAPVTLSRFGFVAFCSLDCITPREHPLTETSKLQLEHGLIVFALKLLENSGSYLALRTLHLVRRRICGYFTNKATAQASVVRKDTMDYKITTSANASSIADLFNVPDNGVKAPAIASLLLQYESAILRLLKIEAGSSLNDVSLQPLDCKSILAPSTLLESAMVSHQFRDKTRKTSDEVLQQLEVLAMDFAGSNEPCSSTKAFQCLTILLKNRVRVVQLIQKASDVQGIWQTYAKLYTQALKASANHKPIDLKAARKSFNDVQTFVAECGIIDVVPAHVYLYLSQRAADVSDHEEATFWANHHYEAMDSNTDSTARVCAAEIRLTTLAIHCDDHEELMRHIRRLTLSLAEKLSGSNSDLAFLLSEMKTLRKTIAKRVRAATPSRTSGPSLNIISYAPSLLNVLNSVVRFYMEYLQAMSKATSNDVARIVHRRQQILDESTPLIDLVMSLVRHQAQSPLTEIVALQVCADTCVRLSKTLLTSLPQACNENQQETHLYENTCIRCSDFHWSVFENSSRSNDSVHQLLALRSCCNALADLSPGRKAAGSLAFKLHRLGRLLHREDRHSEAQQALAECLSLSLETGCFEAIHGKISFSSLVVLDNAPAAKVFFSALKTWIEIEIDSKTGYTSSLWDDSDLDEDIRGAILEWQLRHLNTRHRQLPHSLVLKQSVVRRCLEIYTEQQRPLRRRRILIHYLRCTTPQGWNKVHGEMLALASQLLEKSQAGPALDNEMNRFSDHLNATLSTAIGIHEPKRAGQLFNQALTTWSQVKLRNKDDEIDEVAEWVQDVELLAQYYYMTSHTEHELSAHSLLLGESSLSKALSSSVSLRSLVRIAQCLTTLGYTTQAHHVLGQVQKRLQDAGHSPRLRTEYHLAHANCCLELGDVEGSKEHLQKCEFSDDADSQQNKQTSSAPKFSTPSVSSVLRDASFLDCKSRVAVGYYDLDNAFCISKRCLKILQNCWHSLQSASEQRSLAEKKADNSDEALKEALTRLQLNDDIDGLGVTVVNFLGVSFWGLAPALARAALHVAVLAASLGFRSEALAAEQEALKLARALPTSQLLTVVLGLRADHARQAEEWDAGRRFYQEGLGLLSSQECNKQLLEVHMLFGIYSSSVQKWQEAMDHFAKGSAIYDLLNDPGILQALISNEDLVPAQDTTSSATVRSPSSRPATKKQAARKRRDPHPSPSRPKRSVDPHWQRISGRLESAAARCFLAQGLTHEAANAVSQDTSQSLIGANPVEEDRHLVWAEILTRIAANALAKDAVLSMLDESTIAMPALLPHSADRDSSAPTSFMKAFKSERHIDVCYGKTRGKPAELLMRSLETALAVERKVGEAVTSESVGRISATVVSVMTLLSLPALGTGNAFTSTRAISSSLEHPRDVVTRRERRLIESNATHKLSHELTAESPSSTPEPQAKEDHSPIDYLQTLPPLWTVLSLSLSVDLQSLCIARYRGEQPPFILKVPLQRHPHDVDDVDPDVDSDPMLTFEDVRHRLSEIIKASDDTIHSVKEAVVDMDNHGSRKAWWSKRETLDGELKTLLDDIERRWLGGFRSIFSAVVHDQSLLARFQQSLESTLGRHLPSRQRRKANKQQRHFDSRVYELFVNLSELVEESEEIDYALTDLLYFIVDMLQFNKEDNAYDEIDFDAMIVETQDAFRAYRQATNAQDRTTRDTHLILVLDKNLHALPWESFSCLQGKSVSRMPSLCDISDRLAIMRQQQSLSLKHAQQGIQASALDGTYLLNPSKNIPKTEASFEVSLSGLRHGRNWTGFTGRIPAESEIEASLTPGIDATEPPIWLYFGHGSGLQYIRPRRVKALRLSSRPNSAISSKSSFDLGTSTKEDTAIADGSEADETLGAAVLRDKATCAVPLLFGCSSSHIDTHGEFNATGTPLTYLLGGAPAILGALWDVTDGDCDAFAKSVLIKWGLLSREDFGENETETKQKGKSARRKGRGKAKAKTAPSPVNEDSPHTDEKVDICLSEACAKSRGECYLKYLNGAAMVVYGVPVYLGPRD